MKLKNIFAIALSALLFTACSEDDPIGSFDSIKVDKNFVTIPTTGGDVNVTVTAANEWALENLYSVEATIDGKKQKLFYPVPVTLNKAKTEGEPTWLTVDKTSGAAGETVLTLHAGKTEAGRETEICINMGGLKQFIKVRQGELTASAAKCSEIMTGTEGKNYRVTGRVTKISGMEYGNWFLDDGTYDFSKTAKNVDGLYIYGTLDKKGKSGKVNPIDGADGWGFEVGDEITVEGPLSIYNGQYELVNVTVVKIVKSLIQVVTPEQEVELEGGQIEVKVAYKGSGAYYTIADNAKNWITYEGVSYKGGTKTIFEQNPADTAIYKFNIAANANDKRTGAITFTSASGKSSSQVAYTVTQKGVAFPPTGTGTEADPFNVTAAINAAQAGMTGAYVKGIICKAPESVDTRYGSCTYFISADGKTTSDQLQVYSGLFLQKEQFTSKDQLKVGDEVIVVGDLKMYKGAPEIDKNNWIVSLNGKTSVGGEAPAGTVNNPFTIAQAFAYIDAAGADNVYIKGKVSKIVYAFDASHKTGTFWISEDGVFNNDLTKDFEAYSVYWLGNKEWADGMGQVAVGDEVVLCGKVTKYTDKNKGTTTYETSSKKAYVYSINGKTE